MLILLSNIVRASVCRALFHCTKLRKTSGHIVVLRMLRKRSRVFPTLFTSSPRWPSIPDPYDRS